MGPLTDRPYFVLVIGAASGIGMAAAEYLAKRGVTVGCLDRNAEGAAAVAGRISAHRGHALEHALRHHGNGLGDGSGGCGNGGFRQD